MSGPRKVLQISHERVTVFFVTPFEIAHMIQPDHKLAFTIPEAAAACSLPVYTIRCAIRNFELTPRKIGKHSILSRDDLLNWINRAPRFIATRERTALLNAKSPSLGKDHAHV